MSSIVQPSGPSCPFSPELTDGAAGRIAAFLSLSLLALAAWGGWGIVLLGLSADFGLRALGWPGFSPIARAAGFLRRRACRGAVRVSPSPKSANEFGAVRVGGGGGGGGRWVLNALLIARTRCTTSFADDGRAAGDLANSSWINSASGSGTAGFTSRTGCGSSVPRAVRVAMTVGR